MSTTRIARRRNLLPLLAVLVLALALRLLLWGRIPRTGLISDEGEYLSAANWLAYGRGFAWYQSYLWTRAPIYPLFVAAHLWLFGDTPAPIYVTQTLLSLLNIILVYLLAQHLTNHEQQTTDNGQQTSPFSIPTLSALLMAIYLPFAIYTQALLSETLYITLLLGGFLALARWSSTIDGRRARDRQTGIQGDKEMRIGMSPPLLVSLSPLIVAGALFGLATLTRSLTLGFLPLATLWVTGFGQVAARDWWRLTRRGVLHGAVFLICAGAVILPWTIYNSARLYSGLVVVDTSGAFNLLLGARTAKDGGRSDAPTRDFVLVLLGQKQAQEATSTPCLRYPEPLPSSQAGRQSAMTSEGLCLLRSAPVAFIQKSFAELIDLFQINYTGAERFANGFAVGHLPRWYAVSLFLLDDTIYVLVLPLAVIGWALTRKRELKIENEQLSMTGATQFSIFNFQFSILIGLWLLYNIAVAPLLFAINRFRLPLLPFAFIFASYALMMLFRSGWGQLRSRYGLACAVLAGLLALVATTPYAYLEPRTPGQDSRWASYLGPYPSSLADTLLAWQTRPSYLRETQIAQALGSGDVASARALLASGDVSARTQAIARPLLAGLEGQPDAGLKLLPPLEVISQTKDVELAVVRGELLRRAGDLPGARFIFTQRFVDDANPVQWAWDWLDPPPLPDNDLDLAGNLDLGYIAGCYLGEGGDREVKGNFRWCTDGARLRFPGAGTGTPQTLTLRADGRGWPNDMLPAPPVRVFVGTQAAGEFTPDTQSVREFTVTLPPTPRGADVIVTLRMVTFIPPADRYLKQQGKPVVGQVQRLGVLLDRAELRELGR